MIRFAFLLAALHVALPVEAKPVNLRLAFMDRKEVGPAEASADDLCFVETGKGKAKRRTPYILDFDGQCRAMNTAVHHKKKLRNHRSKCKCETPARAKIAAPVKLQCAVKSDSGKKVTGYYGRSVAVVVDLEALTVSLDAPETGLHWEYRNGQTAPLLTKAPPEIRRLRNSLAVNPVAQFVRLTPKEIIMGHKNDDDIEQYATLNRSALDRHAVPCVVHVSVQFGAA